MALMTVYHGGYQAVEKPEIRVSRNTKDFGTGFYCTVINEQAQRSHASHCFSIQVHQATFLHH